MNEMLSAGLSAATWADFHYLVPMAERPGGYTYAPPQGVPQTNASHEVHGMQVRSARSAMDRALLDVEGYAVLRQRSLVQNFDDEAELLAVYYPESEALLKAATGADRVVIFDHTRRRRVAGDDPAEAVRPNQPVLRVHVDHTSVSGPERVRFYLGAEAEELLKGRVQIINFWRPTRGPVRDMPLAFADARSVAPADLVATDIIYPDRRGELYSVTHNPEHRWFYLPEMQTDEVLLIKCYDSIEDGRARFTPHTAFVDPNTPEDAPLRESIELRALVFGGR